MTQELATLPGIARHMFHVSEPGLNKLVAVLQSAYSGELAAAYAYRGHWHARSQ